MAEQAHYRLKDALDQALMLRGSRDFDSAESYTGFVRKVVERRNRLVQGKLEEERPLLQCLPPAPVPEYVNHQARVRKWSTVQAAGRTYTVPSRLIGKEVQIRLYAERLEVYYKGHLVERMERVRGEREANVNYRHVIGSLVRKLGAFARYRFREQMFPTMTFRLAYDALKRWRGERADVEYVRCQGRRQNIPVGRSKSVPPERSLASVNVRASCSGEVSQRQAGNRLGG